MAEQQTIATPEQEAAWYDVLGKFKQWAAQFEALVNKLESQKHIAAKNPELTQEYNNYIRLASEIEDKIRSIKEATTSVVDWFTGTFGFDGAQSLGFVPLIPIAVMIAAVAAISKFVSDAYVFSKKLDKVAELEQKGMPTSQAVSTVQDLTPERSILGFDPKWWVIGGIALVTLPVLIPAVKSVFNSKS